MSFNISRKSAFLLSLFFLFSFQDILSDINCGVFELPDCSGSDLKNLLAGTVTIGPEDMPVSRYRFALETINCKRVYAHLVYGDRAPPVA